MPRRRRFAQWERAFRGADDRPYPWGKRLDWGKAVLGPTRAGPVTPSANRLSSDHSPFGVWSMAGNMSEWVQPPPGLDHITNDYLKGGNWWHKETYANGGCLLAVKTGYRGPYAGFRIARRWPAAGKPEAKR